MTDLPGTERDIALRMGLDPDGFPPGALLAGLPDAKEAECEHASLRLDDRSRFICEKCGVEVGR